MEEQNKIQDEIDFKEVIKTPIRWFGLIYPFFTIIIIAVGILYINALPGITQSKIEPVVRKTYETELKIKKGSIQEGVDIKLVSIPNDEMIAKGKELFKANCASCHGDEGNGDGTAGASLNPKPRNFHSSDGWKNGRKISQMFKTIEEGISGSGMSAYEYLPVKDRFAIIHYIRTFANDFPQDTPDELAELDNTYSLSQGKETPSQIPISKAIEINSSNGEIEQDMLNEILNYLETQKSKEGYKLFDKVASNKFKCIFTLSKNQDWKNNIQEFIKIVTSSTPNNGFKTEVYRLSNDEWKELFGFLSTNMT
jgi:hypothetical protein